MYVRNICIIIIIIIIITKIYKSAQFYKETCNQWRCTCKTRSQIHKCKTIEKEIEKIGIKIFPINLFILQTSAFKGKISPKINKLKLSNKN